jgi:hypothetical protein
MLAASIAFLTPEAALVGLTALVPLGALLLVARRGRHAARLLGLEPAGARPFVLPAVLAAGAVGLLALAAAQPVLRTVEHRRARADSQLFVVVDVSRSMLASRTPTGPTRLDRARTVAARLRAAVPDVPAGLAGVTDRVLPYVFPTLEEATYADTLRRSVGIETPPPQQVETVATTFDALAGLAGAEFFSPGTANRTCVVVTDGESRSFDPGGVSAALAGPGGCKLVVVGVGSTADRVYRGDGKPEAAYRPDAAASSKLAELAAATGGRAYDEGDLDAAADAVRRAAERGPTERARSGQVARNLAPACALAALLLVVALVALRATAWLRRETPVSYSWQRLG